MPNLASSNFRYPEGRHAHGELRYREDRPILSVAGNPRQMGEAIGDLALKHAPRMAAYPGDLLKKFCAGWLAPLILRVGSFMVKRFPADYRHEMEAITDAAKVDPRQVILGNTLFDIKKILACSALVVEPSRSATGHPLLARNLDYPSEGFAHEYGLVTIYRPEGKLPFVSVGFPGLVGVLSGMNAAGLALAVLEVYQAPLFVRRFDPRGTPYALCFRSILETCRTREEARLALQKMRRTTLFNLALADRTGVEMLEVTPSRVRQRPAVGGVGTCVNHFQHRDLQTAFPINCFKTFDRDRALCRVRDQVVKFDIESLRQGLHRTHQGDHTLQTMIFEPASLRLHLGMGHLPSTAGPLACLDLARDLNPSGR